MTHHTQRESLNPLKQQETIEWRQRSPGVSLSHGSTPRDIGRVAVMLDIDHPVICGSRLVQHLITLGRIPPRKLSAVHNLPPRRLAIRPPGLGHELTDNSAAL